MRGVIIGTDFVRDTDGAFKAIETNTNIHTAVNCQYYFDVNILDQIISGTQINEINYIYKTTLMVGYAPEIELTPESEKTITNPNVTGSLSGLDMLLQYYCDSKGLTYNSIGVEENSITIPQIEDSDNKLIIRIAYDVTALIDDTYARDNWEFLKLMYDTNPSSIPKTYINDSELGFDSLGNVIRDNGIHPNYCVKKRITPADNHIHPKLYKINTIVELDTLKSELADDEYIQEYILNPTDLLDDKLTHYRSVDFIYGPNLDVLNLWSVQFSNTLDLDNVCDLDDENKIPIWERPKYFYKYNNNEKAPKISGDGSTKVFLPDNSLTLLSNLNENDSVKSIIIPDLPLDESQVDLRKWSGSFTNLINNFEVSSSQLTNLTKREDYVGFFWNIECGDNIKFSDVSHAKILKKELESGSQTNYITRFVQYNLLEPNDTLILFDSQTQSLIEKNIQTITYTYDKVEVYAVDFEEIDLFLTCEENGTRYGLITHNINYDCSQINTPSVDCALCFDDSRGCHSGPQCCRCHPQGSNYPVCGTQAGECYGPPEDNEGLMCQNAYEMTCEGGAYCNGSKSDIAYKENIVFIGKSDSGINIYQFNYKGENGIYEGVIGNELIGTAFEHALMINPEDGLLLVDYYKIDVQFKKIN